MILMLRIQLGKNKKVLRKYCRQDFFDIADKPGRDEVVLDEVP